MEVPLPTCSEAATPATSVLPMATASASPRTSAAHTRVLDALIAEQERMFRERQKTAARMHQEALHALAGGVTSSWQISQPSPIWISHGKGSHVWDVDGHEYVDYHGGYGVGLAGHAHPAIVEAVSRRVTQGTHFGQPVPDAPFVAEELAKRFGLPLWRFSNSGTEATMNAIHLARSITGRFRLVKFTGAYHGHHDSVRTSIWHEPTDTTRPSGTVKRTRASSGIPAQMLGLTRALPFNDLNRVRDEFADPTSDIACVIVEPVLMNCGIIYPEPGFLE